MEHQPCSALQCEGAGHGFMVLAQWEFCLYPQFYIDQAEHCFPVNPHFVNTFIPKFVSH